MMKIIATLACLHVAWDSAEKAMKIQPQHIFAPGAEAIWWICAASWIASAIGTFVLLQERR